MMFKLINLLLNFSISNLYFLRISYYVVTEVRLYKNIPDYDPDPSHPLGTLVFPYIVLFRG